MSEVDLKLILEKLDKLYDLLKQIADDTYDDDDSFIDDDTVVD